MASEFKNEVEQLTGAMARHGNELSGKSVEVYGLASVNGSEQESPLDELKFALAAASRALERLEQTIQRQIGLTEQADQKIETVQEGVILTAGKIARTLDGSGNAMAESAIEQGTMTVTKIDEARYTLDRSAIERAEANEVLNGMHAPLTEVMEKAFIANGLITNAVETTQQAAASIVIAATSADETAENLRNYWSGL